MNHGFEYYNQIDRNDAGKSIAQFYAGKYLHSDLETWITRVTNGEVFINGQRANTENTIAAGDKLVWFRPPWEEPEVPRNFKIVYEDDSVIVIDKPAGLPALPDGGFLENTLVHFIRERYHGESPSPAHRLGRGTSGLIVFGRNQTAVRDLVAQFRDTTARRGGALRKTYHAITAAYPGGKAGDIIEIHTPIGLIPHKLLGEVFAAKPDGKPSFSKCRILRAGVDSTLWEIDLITGRAHQIRIHLASIGVPLRGDPLFLPGGIPNDNVLPGDCGYYLRSVGIEFIHPTTRQRMNFSLPDVF